MFVQPLFLLFFLILVLYLYITMMIMMTTPKAEGKVVPRISSVVYL